MQPPLYVPKNKEQYIDLREQVLYEYFAKDLGWGELMSSRACFEFLIEARNFSKGKTVLDAGAGQKRFEPFFTESNYLTLEHPSGIAMKGMAHISYDYVCELDGDNFLPSDNSIDLIYSHSVLEHIERPEKFFANAIKCLKQSGRLFLNVPFMYLEHETPYDFNRFTRYGLKSRLEEAGFRILKLLPSSNSIEGTTAFILDGIINDAQSRGLQAENFTIKLPDSDQEHPLLPLVQHIIGSLYGLYDDAIYDSTASIGWLCVAEKPAV
ncbi:methyltransferase domain-containing protein [Rhodoferax sp. 4810]|uniref:Methyltransferase domain-containing protein n=1 Tax=Thiospirillum jenense TaxID=1653858 RepID=A0A839H673_9GAMM|nr:methyltransferase domain-containing protein [Thiospirillum jenense]MBB1072986.1 methyltransferase domain-containing protein [Rhodoferax jenense]MBB1124934.1 methyltransferase domain-containing protein [Thiospirillum jenense]